jgi:hypothetical protein
MTCINCGRRDTESCGCFSGRAARQSLSEGQRASSIEQPGLETLPQRSNLSQRTGETRIYTGGQHSSLSGSPSRQRAGQGLRGAPDSVSSGQQDVHAAAASREQSLPASQITRTGERIPRNNPTQHQPTHSDNSRRGRYAPSHQRLPEPSPSLTSLPFRRTPGIELSFSLTHYMSLKTKRAWPGQDRFSAENFCLFLSNFHNSHVPRHFARMTPSNGRSEAGSYNKWVVDAAYPYILLPTGCKIPLALLYLTKI